MFQVFCDVPQKRVTKWHSSSRARAAQTASRPLHSVMSSATGVTAILSPRRGASWIICSAGHRRHTDATTDRQLTGKREDVCAAARRRGRRIKFRQLQLKMHKQNTETLAVVCTVPVTVGLRRKRRCADRQRSVTYAYQQRRNYPRPLRGAVGYHTVLYGLVVISCA